MSSLKKESKAYLFENAKKMFDEAEILEEGEEK